MTGARDIIQLCCSPNLSGIVANKIEQSFYSVYSYSRIELIERTLNNNGKGKVMTNMRRNRTDAHQHSFVFSFVI